MGNLTGKDCTTQKIIKNAFITNILGVSMQYSPEKYIKMRDILKKTPISTGADLFNVSSR